MDMASFLFALFLFFLFFDPDGSHVLRACLGPVESEEGAEFSSLIIVCDRKWRGTAFPMDSSHIELGHLWTGIQFPIFHRQWAIVSSTVARKPMLSNLFVELSLSLSFSV